MDIKAICGYMRVCESTARKYMKGHNGKTKTIKVMGKDGVTRKAKITDYSMAEVKAAFKGLKK